MEHLAFIVIKLCWLITLIYFGMITFLEFDSENLEN